MMCPVNTPIDFEESNTVLSAKISVTICSGAGELAGVGLSVALLSGLTFTAFGIAEGELSGAERGARDERVAGAEPWPRAIPASAAKQSIAQTASEDLIPMHFPECAPCPGPPS